MGKATLLLEARNGVGLGDMGVGQNRQKLQNNVELKN